MGMQIFLTGLVFFLSAMVIAKIYEDKPNPPLPIMLPVIAMFFGGFAACMTGALISIWS
jgi:hypothetical protein